MTAENLIYIYLVVSACVWLFCTVSWTESEYNGRSIIGSRHNPIFGALFGLFIGVLWLPLLLLFVYVEMSGETK